MNPYTFISGGVLRGERYDLRKATVIDLIGIAYAAPPETILGGPNWLEFDRFDVAAKAPAGSTPEDIRLMLQSMLADRFRLALHKDMRPMPAYALTQGKVKPKLEQATGDGMPECKYQPQPQGSAYGAGWACRNITMSAFAERLRAIAGDYLTDPVVDATGLDGAWDFDLKWNNRSQVLAGGAERTTIFAAVEKQLGLELTLRNAPTPVLVIDRVNEKPTANALDVAQKLPPRELQFEVADLKPSRPEAKPVGLQVTPGGGLIAEAMDMRVLLAAAWDIDWDHLERFAGLPKWVDGAKFDIHAKASTNTTGPPILGTGYLDDDVRLMLRALLMERFKMQVHYEDRLVNAYALVTGKPGANKVKMKRAQGADRASCREAHSVENDPRDRDPKLAELIMCRNASMAQFASQLQPLAPDYFAYPVEDATGLTGSWDFSLSFSPSWMVRDPGLEAPAGVAGEPTGALSVADAIRKQLGLRLEMRKRKLPVVVIDHMEEKPTEN